MWVYKDQSSNYDYKYIKHLQEQMLAARSSLDYETLIHTIRSHSFRNVGNILNPKLYSHAKTQTKDLIECYLKVCL
jgi:TAG lipase/steryl ester hydrolase/phospholipase A2/LPA acyltransferase